MGRGGRKPVSTFAFTKIKETYGKGTKKEIGFWQGSPIP